MAEEYKYHHDPAAYAAAPELAAHAEEDINVAEYHQHQAAVAAAVAAEVDELHHAHHHVGLPDMAAPTHVGLPALPPNQDGLPALPVFKGEDVEYGGEVGEHVHEGVGEVGEHVHEGVGEVGEHVHEDVGEVDEHVHDGVVAHEGVVAHAGVEEGALVVVKKDEPPSEGLPPGSTGTPLAAMTVEEMDAVTAAAAAAPLEIRPKKKRKKNEEFTVAKKLLILEQLDGPNAPTVQALAIEHSTTKGSIYRWKKDRRRLIKLVRKEGKGEFKRASLKRKMNNEEFTAFEKLAMVRELEIPEMTVRKLSDKHGANRQSVYRWIKDKERLIQLVETEGKGSCKRVGNDPLQRVKDSVAAFYNQNNLLPPGEKLTFTGAIVAAKARQSKDHFLAEHNARPFLSDQEVKSMTDFSASESWGRKILLANGWSNGRKKSALAVPKHEGDTLEAQAAAMASRKPRVKREAKGAKTKQTAAQKRMRSEISSLRTDMGELRQRTEGAEERELRLANENEELRREIAWLKMRSL